MEKIKSESNNTIQAFWVGIGSLSSFALAIVSAAILSRYLDKAEYGTYRQILYVYNTLLIVFTAGLPRVFAYFLPRYSIEQGKDIVFKISKILFFIGILFSMFLFSFSELIANILNNPELAIGLKYFSPIPMLLLPTLGIEGIFSTYKKTVYIAIYNTLSRFLMLACIVLPVVLLKGTYLSAIYGWLAVSVITFFVAYYFKGIPFKKVKKEKTTLRLKEVFLYSFPLVGASLAGIAIRSADQFFISRYFGAEVFAEYANGFIQLPFVAMVTGATSIVLMPQFSKMVHDRTEIKKIATLWKSTLTKSAIVIYPAVIFFIFNARPVVVLLYSETYVNSVIFFQIAMIVNFFNIIVFAPLLFSLGETKFYSVTHIVGAFAAWLGGFIIVQTIPRPEYIAILSVIITISLILINLKKTSKLLNLRFFNLIPLQSIYKLIFHSLLILSILSCGKYFLWNSLSEISMLIVDFIGYSTLLLLSAKLFKIDYFSVLKPLFIYKK